MLFTDAYSELSFYTLAHPDQLYFIHQHIVDAQTAQTASVNTKPISIVFALVGLYLTVEKGYTGREVQQVHMQLAASKDALPTIALPVERGTITVDAVLNTPPGEQRDAMIKQWCTSVWNAYKDVQGIVIAYLTTSRIE
jgi:hypothetical protein